MIRLQDGCWTSSRVLNTTCLSFYHRGQHCAASRSEHVSQLKHSAACCTLQDEQVAALPEAKAQLTTAIQSTEARLKALRALQPDWARLERLRAVETAGTRAKLENLEAKASIEAGEAGELHRQHEELQRQLQVLSWSRH